MRCSLPVALAALLTASGSEAKTASARMHVGANVVSSAGVETRSLAGAQVQVRSRVFGGDRGGAVLVHQRSGAPVLLGGDVLPRDASAAIVVQQGALPLSGTGPAEVVVTLFPDGAPPAGVREAAAPRN